MDKIKPTILSDKTTYMYDYELVKIRVKAFFEKYKECITKKRLIAFSINDPLGNDNMGIFSSTITNTVHNKVEQMEKISRYIDNMNSRIDFLKKEFTEDEKIIFQMSILDDILDEDIADAVCMTRRGLYSRKKSCYIKTAIFFNLDVLRKGVKFDI